MVSHACSLSTYQAEARVLVLSLRPAGTTEGETPFQKQQRAGEVGETGLEKKQYPRKRPANSVEMTKCEARTHTKILCIFVYYFVCMPCVLCVCVLGSWRMCHNMHV